MITMRIHAARVSILAALAAGGVSPIAHGQVDACDPVTGVLDPCLQQSYDAAKGDPPPAAEPGPGRKHGPGHDKDAG